MRNVCDATPLLKASRLAAKADNSAVQDGYQLYYHVFFSPLKTASASCSKA